MKGDFNTSNYTSNYIRVAILVDALRDIAAMPTVQINPDGDDQAAATMQFIAREALRDWRNR